MEKFFRVAAGSEIEKEYFESRDIQKKISDFFFDDFSKRYNISTNQFIPYTSRLVIIPNENDKKLFSKEFLIGKEGYFKVKSPTGKAWVQECIDKNFEFKHKPYLPFLFRPAVSCRWNMWDYNGIIYCSFSSESFIVPNDFIEIKPSEYYTILEIFKNKE